MVDYKVTELNEEIDFGNLPYWDVVIIGAGPGGLAASLTTAHRGLTTLVSKPRTRPAGSRSFSTPTRTSSTCPASPTASAATSSRTASIARR